MIGEPVGHAGKDHSFQFTADDVAEDALAGTVNINNHVDYIDPSVCRALPRTGASLTGEFRLRDGGVPSTLWGSYTHTFAASPSSSIQGISGGYGGLSLDLSLAASTAWSIAHPADPEDALGL